MRPLERRLGGRVTFLSDTACTLLDAMGTRQAVPWYDRLFFRARAGHMSLPVTAVVGTDGRLLYLYRSRRVDDRPRLAAVLAASRGANPRTWLD
jgi:hypothetical protein